MSIATVTAPSVPIANNNLTPHPSILRRIWNFVKSIFQALASLFCFTRESSTKLTANEINLLRSYQRHIDSTKRDSIVSDLVTQLQDHPQGQEISDIETIRNSRKNLTTTFCHFSNLAVSIIFDKYIQPWITKHQNKLLPKIQFCLESILPSFSSLPTEQLDLLKEDFLKKLNEDLLGKLPGICELSLRINARQLAVTSGQRIITILEKIQFSELIDGIIELFSEHVGNIVSVQTKADTLLNKAKSYDPNKANKLDPLLATQLSSIKEELVKQGEETTFKKLLYAEWIDQPTCHEAMKPIFKEAMKNSFNVTKADPIIPPKVFRDGIDKMFKMALPGGITKVHKQFIITSEVKTVQEHIKNLFGTAITQGDDPETIKNIATFCFEKKMGIIKQIVHSQFSKVSNQIFNLLTHPHRLGELVATAVLPSFKTLLIRTFLMQTFCEQLKLFSPLFFKLITQSNNLHITSDETKKEWAEKVQHTTEEIKRVWLEITKKRKLTFEFGSEGYSLDALNITFSTLITELQDYLLFIQTKNSLSEEKVYLHLQAYFIKPTPQFSNKEHEIYGKLIENLVFKLAQFGYKTNKAYKNLPWIQKIITTLTLSSLERVRSSYEMLTELACSTFDTNYGTRDKLQTMIFGPHDPYPKIEETNKKLETEIQQISHICYDLIMRSTEYGIIGTTWATGLALGQDSSHLSKLFMEIYKKTFSDRLLNCNLGLKVQDFVLQSLFKKANILFTPS